LAKNFRGREQDGCSQNEFFFIGRGLHYGQDFFGGELQAWMKKRHACQRGNTFCYGVPSFGAQVFDPWIRNLTSKELEQLETLWFFF
jgi:hypothetical protein